MLLDSKKDSQIRFQWTEGLKGEKTAKGFLFQSGAGCNYNTKANLEPVRVFLFSLIFDYQEQQVSVRKKINRLVHTTVEPTNEISWDKDVTKEVK